MKADPLVKEYRANLSSHNEFFNLSEVSHVSCTNKIAQAMILNKSYCNTFVKNGISDKDTNMKKGMYYICNEQVLSQAIDKKFPSFSSKSDDFKYKVLRAGVR